MNSISEKVAYLKGLADGMTITDANTAKLIAAVIDALSALSVKVDEHDVEFVSVEERIDDLFNSVDDIEEYVLFDDDDAYDFFDDDDDVEFLDDDDEESCGCKDCNQAEDCCDDILRVQCQSCGKDVCIDCNAFASDDVIRCPHCGEVLFK